MMKRKGTRQPMGQHFLTAPGVLDDIVKSANIEPSDNVVEIGAGKGALTDALIATGAHVIAIEKDPKLAEFLRLRYAGKNIEIIEADVLSYKLQDISYKLVGNLPYYLTSHLLRIVLQTWPRPELMVFMVQKEVAQRMMAKPPHMNMLAVLVQCYTKPELIRYVKRGSFVPPPKVDSAVVKLTPLTTTHYSLLDLASKGFKHPRKKLSNNIDPFLLECAKIDPSRRAETLTIEEWQALASVV
jgi:16S rRNA (adenine1518-N6/adenine1519-N6)-dimethyltransferase